MNNITKLALATMILGSPTLASAGEGWTGFYLGAHVAATDGEISAGGLSISDSATAYGLQIGYDHSLPNNLVIGGELSYSTAEYSYAGLTGDLDTTRLKFKGGYDLGSTMVYGILGYASIDDGAYSEGGTTFGIGVNYKASNNIILGAELLRDSFDIVGVDVEVDSISLGVSYQF